MATIKNAVRGFIRLAYLLSSSRKEQLGRSRSMRAGPVPHVEVQLRDARHRLAKFEVQIGVLSEQVDQVLDDAPGRPQRHFLAENRMSRITDYHRWRQGRECRHVPPKSF